MKWYGLLWWLKMTDGSLPSSWVASSTCHPSFAVASCAVATSSFVACVTELAFTSSESWHEDSFTEQPSEEAEQEPSVLRHPES